MDQLLQNFFNLDIYRSVAPYLLQGLVQTLLLSAIVIPVGLASGLAIGVLSITLKRRWTRFLLAAYIDFFRALPPLVLLIFIYFGAPFLGLDLPKLLAVAIGFMLNNSSYYGEVFRAGLESVPRGQVEAARSTGLSAAQTLWHVQIPQAARSVMPDLISNTLEVVKLTTLASAVALPELLRVARDAQSLVYNPSPIVLAALFYLALLWPVVRLLSRLEHRHIASR
ncbi:amino acid ABC transporter permease [Bordetella genomosp. 11]|uniref:Polar amino acid ABC transporter permease n=1 Tax=Bordetella genomosp. 11 TaxID=1416808 RepID=A0A261ULH4_9BORD|nr:amino acid ABC transporter permease [Bordetella genomosp. 11]OZI62387.1 polar amino acid ABC transporter permease [Bordetella genomosp. 11]